MARQRQKRGRDVNGILLLDKPSGVTSNDVLQRIKRLYDARKVGHTGSLDKTATGLLPLCFGDATKFSGYLLDADKHYRASCQLGIETTTGDAAGEVLKELPLPADLNVDMIEQAMSEFRGDIQQIPPMYSALKHKGERLYKLAYQGIEVERPPRPVTIHQLELIELGESHIEIDVICTKGTYIRTLAEELGKHLGCGAHVSKLRRIGAGPYSEESMIDYPTLEKLALEGPQGLDDKLLPVDTAVMNLPAVNLIESVAFYLSHGQAVTVAQAPTSGLLRLYNSDKQFMGLGEVLEDGRIAPRRMLKLH
jgi:tRNA pseudouridine55 synthase